LHDLIEAIRAAITEDATAEARAAGILACRTLLAALETEPRSFDQPPPLDREPGRALRPAIACRTGAGLRIVLGTPPPGVPWTKR
jgi:hypothetical protein